MFPTGGAYTVADDGVYSINTNAKQIKDAKGRWVVAMQLGIITIAIKATKA
jgi:hypothetical protein